MASQDYFGESPPDVAGPAVLSTLERDRATYGEQIAEFFSRGIGARDTKNTYDEGLFVKLNEATKFYGLDKGKLNIGEIYKECYVNLTKLTKKAGHGGGNKRRNQRGGTRLNEFLQLVGLVKVPEPATHFDRVFWFYNEAGKAFNVVYDLLHNALTPLPLTKPTIWGQISSLSGQVPNALSVAVAAARAAAHTAAARATVLSDAVAALRAAGHVATASTRAMPLRVQMFWPEDRLPLVVTMIKNINPAHWPAIIAGCVTAVSFLEKMYEKLQVKLEAKRRINKVITDGIIAKDKVDSDAQARLFHEMYDKFFKVYLQDMGHEIDLDGSTSPKAPSEEERRRAEKIMDEALEKGFPESDNNDYLVKQAEAEAVAQPGAEAQPEAGAVQRTDTLPAGNNTDLYAVEQMTPQAHNDLLERARAQRLAQEEREAATREAARLEAARLEAATREAATREAAKGTHRDKRIKLDLGGGNRTMNRRKKSRRSKTIRKKRRLGNPIKKRKQFTKKRKARNKGKRKTRR